MTDVADFKKTEAAYSAKRGEIRILDVPDMQFLMIDGHGDPNTSQEYADALAALYPVAYKLKFASKRELGRDYVVMPLEGLWWADDMSAFTSSRDKALWDWTMMTMIPAWIDHEIFDLVAKQVAAKDPPVSIGKLRLATLAEGRAVQTLHLGSYDDEGPVLAQIHDDFIPSHRLRMVGKHHEIYFSDARRVAPEKLRTILRQPVGTA